MSQGGTGGGSLGAPEATGDDATPGPRRRLLVLAPRFPYPVVGGDRLRIYHLARVLSARHRVTLLSLCRTRAELTAPVPEDGVFAEVHRVLLPPWRSWLSTAAALPTRTPLQVAYYRSGAFRRQVDELLPRHDVVLCHLLRTAEYVQAATQPRVLEMTDAVSMAMARAARVRTARVDLRQLVYRTEAGRLRGYERAQLARFDLTSLTSSVDRDHLVEPGDAFARRVLVVPNGVTSPDRERDPAAVRPAELCFIANLHTLQNRDALWFFVRQVLPAVRDRVPEARLRVIGPAPAGDARALVDEPGVQVVGEVPDLSAAVATTAIGVCPIRIGAGVQNKLLDYLAHGLAAVTSPVGLEGLDAEPGRHLLTADDPAEWVERILSLVTDPAAARRIGAAGRHLVRTQYGWERRVAPLVAAIDALPVVHAATDS